MNALLLALRWDLPDDKEELTEERRDVYQRYRVLNISAMRPVERSLRFSTGSTPSMGSNHGEYRGVKTTSTPTEFTKAGTRRE
jgi:hypothetical protein